MNCNKDRSIAKALGIVTSDRFGDKYKTDTGFQRCCPEYGTDLHSAHEAERKLTPFQHADFCQRLTEICGSMTAAISADAHDRREALIRTLNL